MNVEEAKRIVADQKELVEEKLSQNYIKRDVGDVERFLRIPNVLAEIREVYFILVINEGIESKVRLPKF